MKGKKVTDLAMIKENKVFLEGNATYLTEYW